MKKFKWVSCILVICILAGSMVGCAGGNKQEETGSTKVTPSKENSTEETPATSGKVTFWNDKLATVAEIAKKLTDVWTTSTGLEIDVNSYGDTASYQTAMSQSIDNASAAPFFLPIRNLDYMIRSLV